MPSLKVLNAQLQNSLQECNGQADYRFNDGRSLLGCLIDGGCGGPAPPPADGAPAPPPP